MAFFGQRSDESLGAYGERAVRLRQLIDVADEGFLVSRFLRGVRDRNIRQMIAVGQEDMSKLTVAQVVQRIMNLSGAGNDSDSEEDSESSGDDSEQSSDDELYKKHRKWSSRGKASEEKKATKAAQKKIQEMEEKLKRLESEGREQKGEAFAIQQASRGSYQNQGPNGYQRNQGPGNYQQDQGRQESGQGGGYTCYNCGMPGHMARFCPDR